MRKALVLLLAAAAAVCAATDSDLHNAEKAWATAVVARDPAGLDQILAGDLIYAHSTGAVESKQDYINRLRSGAQRYDSITHEKIRVVLHGDSAITHSIARMTGISNGKPFNDHLMFLHCWILQGGRWRLAAHQSTKIQE